MKIRRGISIGSKMLVAMTVSAVLVGCQHATQGNLTADYPEAEQFPQIYQGKLQAAAHWQLIAENEAQLLVERFERPPKIQLPRLQTHSDMPEFERAYHKFLLAGLLDRDARVFRDGEGFPLHSEMQVVSHRNRQQQNLPVGFSTASSVSGYLIGWALDAWSSPSAVLIPAAIGSDVYNYFSADTETPNTEVIVTTSVMDGDQVLYSHSSVYYFQSRDRGLYRSSGNIAVRGDYRF